MQIQWFTKVFIGCAILLVGISIAKAERHALLVGVGDYHVKPLAGPVNDVAVMKQVLADKWGFNQDNIKTILNKQGTKKNILAAIEQLYHKSKSGDEVFIYLSGHGTSAADKELSSPLPTTSGAFIPIDIANVKTMDELVNKLVIGRNDLRPLFKKFDEGNRHVFVAIDACYSGNTVRGVFGKKRLAKRFMHVRDILPSRAFGDDLDFSSTGDWSAEENSQNNSYPYKNIYYLSASGEHEPAQDIPPNMVDAFPTIDGKSHGAFSDTLLQILNKDIDADVDGDGVVTYSELKKTVRDKMRMRGFDHTPQGLPSLAEDTGELSSKSIFGDSDNKPQQVPLAQVAVKTNAATNIATNAASTTVASKPAVSAENTTSSAVSQGKPQAQKPPKQTKPATSQSSASTAAAAIRPQAKPQKTVLVDPEKLQVTVDPFYKEVLNRANALSGVQLVDAQAKLEVRRDGADALFISQAGDLILRLQKPSVSKILDNIRHQAWIHQLVETPFKQDFNVDLELYGSGRGSTAIEGELVGFSIKSAHKAYILLIDIDPHGTINVLYPYTPAELAPVDADRLLAFKDLTRVTPPFGRDYLQAYAFTDISEDYKALRGKSFSLGSPYVKNLQRLINSSRFFKARTSLELVTSKAN